MAASPPAKDISWPGCGSPDYYVLDDHSRQVYHSKDTKLRIGSANPDGATLDGSTEKPLADGSVGISSRGCDAGSSPASPEQGGSHCRPLLQVQDAVSGYQGVWLCSAVGAQDPSASRM